MHKVRYVHKYRRFRNSRIVIGDTNSNSQILICVPFFIFSPDFFSFPLSLSPSLPSLSLSSSLLILSSFSPPFSLSLLENFNGFSICNGTRIYLSDKLRRFRVLKVELLESASKQCFNYLTPFRHVFDFHITCVKF